MMSLLENLAFVVFLSAIFHVIYWSVRNDDEVGKGKARKFDINRVRERTRRHNRIPGRKRDL